MLEASENSCSSCLVSQSSFAKSLLLDSFSLAPCGHYYCPNCIERQKKKQFPCISCSKTIDKSKLEKKTLDESEVERDLRIRRKIRAIYNRNREDFSALKEFNDYEEDVEDIIFVLVHGTEHEKKIKMEIVQAYEKVNMKEILERQSRKREEDDYILQQITDEENNRKMRQKELLENDFNERMVRLAKVKYNNDQALGLTTESVPTSSKFLQQFSAPPPPPLSTGSFMPSHVSQILCQRPEPSPKVIRENQLSINQQSNIRDVYLAGGFINIDTMYNRDWNEIINHLGHKILPYWTTKA